MTDPEKRDSRPTIPEVLDRFRAYHAREPLWGPLHIVLDDGNVSDDDVDFCIGEAVERNDREACELGAILLRLTKTQRRKLGAVA